MCVQSWKDKNPGWRVVELSGANLHEYVDENELETLNRLEILPVKFSNLLRFYLLRTHGGVWTDATCYCAQPLDTWIYDYLQSGFFAFKFPAAKWLRERGRRLRARFERGPGDRILASWFLASVKGNHLADTVYRRHRDFFANNRFPLKHTDKGHRRVMGLGKILSRNPWLAQLWAAPVLIRSTKIYPYFIVHYHFASIVIHDQQCAAIWDDTPTFMSKGTYRFADHLLAPVTDEIRNELENPSVPMYKLTWKYPEKDFRKGCVLDYLMNGPSALAAGGAGEPAR
jgi:hypothetical protein